MTTPLAKSSANLAGRMMRPFSSSLGTNVPSSMRVPSLSRQTEGRPPLYSTLFHIPPLCDRNDSEPAPTRGDIPRKQTELRRETSSTAQGGQWREIGRAEAQETTLGSAAPVNAEKAGSAGPFGERCGGSRSAVVLVVAAFPPLVERVHETGTRLGAGRRARSGNGQPPRRSDGDEGTGEHEGEAEDADNRLPDDH